MFFIACGFCKSLSAAHLPFPTILIQNRRHHSVPIDFLRRNNFVAEPLCTNRSFEFGDASM
jgi:hypothetical protein